MGKAGIKSDRRKGGGISPFLRRPRGLVEGGAESMSSEEDMEAESDLLSMLEGLGVGETCAHRSWINFGRVGLIAI